MTMVELLVAMAIGVSVTFAVATLLVAGENHKRTTTSTNDADQTGSYAVYAFDRALRGAGSAIAQANSSTTPQSVLGCILNVGGFLPRTGAFPAPFVGFLSGAPSNLRVAPVLIAAGQSDSSASDVLVVMGGSGSAGGVPRVQFGTGGTTSLVLENTVGFFPNDLVLVTNNNTGMYNNGCLVEQVSTTSTSTLNLSNTLPYYTGGTTTTLGALAADTTTSVTPLGNAAANNVQFTMFGVGTNNTLYSYDLLQNQFKYLASGTDNTSQAVADGVIQMNAIYGIATANTAVFSHWANPIAGGGYDITTVMTTPSMQASIISVRVGIVVRGEYYDKNAVSPTSLTLFSGLKDGNGNLVQKVVNNNGLGLDPHYRYRTFEFTVPLRNMIMLAGGP